MSTPTIEELRAWADGLMVRKAWVLHLSTLAVGPVKFFYDGDATKYVSSIDGQEVPSPVLELESGHALTASDPTVFAELSAHDMRLYMALQMGLRGICELAVKNAKASGVTQDKAQTLLVAALQAQLTALQIATPDVG